MKIPLLLDVNAFETEKNMNKLSAVRNVYVPSERTIVSKECIHQKITQLSYNNV